MADIFLSYARSDVVVVDRVATALGRLGWSVWWDTDLNAGDNWSSIIESQLEHARCVVVLWSKISVGRPWVVKEARIGLDRGLFVPVTVDRDVVPPAEFANVQFGALATWDGTAWHPEFQKLVRALTAHLGEPPKPIPAHPPYPLYAREVLGKDRPSSLAELSLPGRAEYHPSPPEWRNELLYLLIPDRFSDGREVETKRCASSTLPSPTAAARPASLDKWAESGRDRWQGGTLAGVISKLPYLQGLGATTVWLWPTLKQRTAADTFHGWAPQDFLDVDPHLGTRQDLVELVAQAHHRNMRVILSGELHHSGTNWVYGPGAGDPMEPRYTSGRHPFGAWLGIDGQPVASPRDGDEAVWPSELQDPDCYRRAGAGELGPRPGEGDDPNAEFMRSDFYTLRTFDPEKALEALIACHRYWLALTDCDGLFLDLAAHVPRQTLDAFCGAVREYGARLGKSDFLIIGEVFGSVKDLESHYARIGRTLHQSLSAILDNGPMRQTLAQVARGFAAGSDWFGAYGEQGGELGIHRALGSRHVSILDDPDGVFGPKLRFASYGPEWQIMVALAIQLLSLGIPCLYYGTEQGLGKAPIGGVPPGWGEWDVFLREAMFGPEHPRRRGQDGLAQNGIDPALPGFGPRGTAGGHAFDESSPLYRTIAALIAVRREFAALRSGRQYQRQVSVGGGPFEFPAAGELVAWSRVLDDEELVCVVNPQAFATKAGRVVVDSTLNRDGAAMRVVFATGFANAAEAGPYRAGKSVDVHRDGRTAYVDLSEFAPCGVIVLSNRAT